MKRIQKFNKICIKVAAFIFAAAFAISEMLLLCGCGRQEEPWRENEITRIDDNYGTYYEVFVYSFCDGDGDGIGDLRGLISKLDYINDGDDTTHEDLGVDGIWLMPIMRAESYHKYDVDDYMSIDPEYGTLEDFDALIKACNQRKLNVIIDLTLNHTGIEHSWFQTAADYLRSCEKEGREPDEKECSYLNYYNFSKENQDGYSRLDGTSWYYECRFATNMPDLNLACNELRAEYEKIVSFWIDRGVKGFRLDAVKEIYTGNTNANVEVLGWFNDMVKCMKPDAYIVGECWTDASTYAKYYASGVDSFFDFQFSAGDGIIASVAKVSNHSANAQTYAKRCQNILERIAQYNPEGIDAPFYVNHDQNRAAGFYTGENAMAELKMGAALNLMMTGNCFVYYGEELGMSGAGRDENKRAPMLWSKEDVPGMCKGPAAMEKFDMKYDSYENQTGQPYSILSFYRDAILLRNQNPEIARGISVNLEEYGSKEVCCIQKKWNGKEVLLLINVSDQAQTIDLAGLMLNSKEIGNAVVRGWLFAGGDGLSQADSYRNGSFAKSVAQMPPFSVLVLQ